MTEKEKTDTAAAFLRACDEIVWLDDNIFIPDFWAKNAD